MCVCVYVCGRNHPKSKSAHVLFPMNSESRWPEGTYLPCRRESEGVHLVCADTLPAYGKLRNQGDYALEVSKS